MEARLLEINSQIEKMILLLGGQISQEVQAEEVQTEEVQTEEVQAGEVQAEEVQADEVQTEEVQAEEVHAVEEQAEEEQAEEEHAEVIQAEEVQAEAVQEFKEDSMPEEEKQEHPRLPSEPCFAAVPESFEVVEVVEVVAPLPEKTPEEELEVLIVECSPTKNEDPEAVADDHKTAEEIFKKAAEAGLAVRQ